MGLLLTVGFVLVGVAALWLVADWGDLSARMPTQLPARRAAWYPLVAGVAVIITGFAVGLSRS